jgi:alpha-tubulin suppressor-like RCC1 family protein
MKVVHAAAKRGKEKPVEEVPEPKECLVPACQKVTCGGEFTMWLCDGKLFAAGSPQNGQLGDGTDHSLNVKDSSIKIMHEPQGIPLQVPNIPSEVMNVACGINHTVCCTKDEECYTWGSGNYGRLGHKVQQVGSTLSDA